MGNTARHLLTFHSHRSRTVFWDGWQAPGVYSQILVNAPVWVAGRCGVRRRLGDRPDTHCKMSMVTIRNLTFGEKSLSDRNLKTGILSKRHQHRLAIFYREI